MSQSAALLLSRDSHLIKKPPPSPSPSRHHHNQHRRHGHHHHHPVIIYTHSPKVIRTKPQDFMALVQKLTGYTRDAASDLKMPPPPATHPVKLEPVNISQNFHINNNINNNNNFDEFEFKEKKINCGATLTNSYCRSSSVVGRMGRGIEYATFTDDAPSHRDGGSSSFPPPIFDPPPIFADFCCTSNSDIGSFEAMLNHFDDGDICCFNNDASLAIKIEAAVDEFRDQFTDFT